MGELCEHALRKSMRAFTERNAELAYAVILQDQYIDALDKEIDRLCLEFLVRQQPVATPLRFAYSAIKINLDMERVGDYAESIARQSLKLLPMTVPLPLERFGEIAELSVSMLRDSVLAFVDQNAELARKTIDIENTVDVLKSKLNHDLVEMYRDNKLPFEALNPLVMIARRLERVSDQARNICMETLYMCTGDFVKHEGAEVFRVLFVDEHNSCRSLMAEAIGNGLRLPRFVFSSAGIDPRPVDKQTLDFMAAKGYDLTRIVPKTVAQVPNLASYQVIISLARSADRAFPQRPRKVVFLDWNVEDPSAASGGQTQAAYEKTFQFIRDHVQDLVGAVTEIEK